MFQFLYLHWGHTWYNHQNNLINKSVLKWVNYTECFHFLCYSIIALYEVMYLIKILFYTFNYFIINFDLDFSFILRILVAFKKKKKKKKKKKSKLTCIIIF